MITSLRGALGLAESGQDLEASAESYVQLGARIYEGDLRVDVGECSSSVDRNDDRVFGHVKDCHVDARMRVVERRCGFIIDLGLKFRRSICLYVHTYIYRL